MSASYDIIVVGGGHNGLTAAALLAKAGRKVLLLERRPFVGGLAAEEEFHPGYRSAGLLHDTSAVRRKIVQSLGLERHGLRMRVSAPDVVALGEQSSLVLSGDAAESAASIGQLSQADAEAYGRYREFLDGIRPAVQPLMDDHPLDLVGDPMAEPWSLLTRALRLRRLGRRRMMELLRLPTMCMSDWLNEWFESDLLKAALALPALAGTFLGPRSPGGNANLLLRECAGGAGVAGDGPALVEALAAAAAANGAEMRTRCTVKSIDVKGGSVQGITLQDGETVRANTVASSCDPRTTLLELLSRGTLSARLVRDMRSFRMRGTTAQVLWALNAPPRFAHAGEREVEFARIAPGLTAIERAFDAVKYRRFSEEPALEVHVPTVARPERAPKGHAVLATLVHYAPYELEAGWDDEQRDLLGDRVLAVLESHLPGFSSTVVARKVLSPVDLEETYGICGGQVHHGEHALDQLLVRPVPDCVGYSTPVEGLFLCGSGSHPGGGLTCVPGSLAAEAILEHS